MFSLNNLARKGLRHSVTQEICTQLEFVVARYHLVFPYTKDYRKTSNISRTLVGNKIVDNSDVVGASPVSAAPTTSSFST